MTVRLTPNHTILLETKHQGTRGGDCRFEKRTIYVSIYDYFHANRSQLCYTI